MEKWIQEQSFEGIHIKKDDGAKTPVANIAVPIGWKNNPRWKTDAEKKANLIVNAPLLLEALSSLIDVFDYEKQNVYSFASKKIDFAKEVVELVKGAEECEKREPSTVQIIGPYVCDNFGFELNSIHKVCNCPKEYEQEYSDHIWVFSKERRTPVRLLDHEYVAVNKTL